MGMCTSAPKSPLVPNDPVSAPTKRSDTERKADANASDKTIVEVLPCTDVTNRSNESSPKRTHAEGFSVNQVKSKVDIKQRVKLEDDSEDPRHTNILECFGFEVHRMLNSKAWDDRSQAIAAAKELCITKKLPQGITPEKWVDGCCKLVLVCLHDKVMPIYFDSLDLAKFLFGEFFQGEFQCDEVVKSNLEELLPVIIAKTADRNARSNEGTRQILTFMARCPSVGCSPVMAHIFTPITNSKEVSAIRGRLDLINHMIDDFGFGKSSTISMQLVMGFVRPHLDATDEKVRRAAIEVTVNCYKHKGDRTLKYITNVKPALLKHLESRFAELSRPAKGARKHAKSAQGLPAVRGKPRMKGPPKRDSNSQPLVGAAPSQGYFSQPRPDALAPVQANHERPEELSDVLKDCSQLFSMGNNMVMSPLSSSAVPAHSLRDDPHFLSNSSHQDLHQMDQDPHFIASPFGRMGGSEELAAPIPGAIGDLSSHLGADLDADLMDEIEGY